MNLLDACEHKDYHLFKVKLRKPTTVIEQHQPNTMKIMNLKINLRRKVAIIRQPLLNYIN